MRSNIVSFLIQSSMNHEDRISFFHQIKGFLSGLECNYPFLRSGWIKSFVK